jgi:hypothetical protein
MPTPAIIQMSLPQLYLKDAATRENVRLNVQKLRKATPILS